MKNLELDANEKKFMLGLLLKLYERSDADSKKVWAILAKKMQDDYKFHKDEIAVLNKAIDATTKIGNDVLEATPADSLEVRVRTQAVLSTYQNIRKKINGQ